MKTFIKFLEEAEQRLKMMRVYHGTSTDTAKKIRSGGFRGSEHGVYGSGAYGSTSRNVARKYAADEGTRGTDTGLVSTIIPKKKVTTIRNPHPEQDTEGRAKSKELRKSGVPAVRVRNAAKGHETDKRGGGYEDEADYVIADPKTASKNIEKTSKVMRPTKSQRTTHRKLYGKGLDDYARKTGWYNQGNAPYVDRTRRNTRTKPKKK